jgi:MscS family membrane protein
MGNIGLIPNRIQGMALRKLGLPGLPAMILLAGLVHAQAPISETQDPLGRNTPQESVFQFLEACHAHDYLKALRYLDLRRMPQAKRAQDGPELARDLEDLLDDTPFDITTLSRDPEGDQSDDLSDTLDRLAAFQVGDQTVELRLERVELKPGYHVWLVSADSVALIPKAHQLVVETPFEKKLPQQLVTFEILDTPIWRWMVLVTIAPALWIAAGFLARALTAVLRPAVNAPALCGPLRLLVVAAGFRAALQMAPPSVLPRLFIERALELLFMLAAAWAGAVVVDLIAERWRTHLDPREQAVTYSVLPLGRQVLKLSLFLGAILSVLSVWGYNTSTILAGIGVGGLAVALAAQKTIENLFGGLSVIGDRPVLVGDVCRFGDRTGTVTHIGLRSTRIRTPDRTIISVPNGQFSSMALENISRRDKIWFHPTLNLRRDTTSEQLLRVLSSFREILTAHSKVEAGGMPVRFIGVGPYSLDIEVVAYVTTSDFDEFVALQQELLLKLLQAVEQAGTALAVPLQESFKLPPAQPAPRQS